MFACPVFSCPAFFQGQGQAQGSVLREVTEGVKILSHYTLHGFTALLYNHRINS